MRASRAIANKKAFSSVQTLRRRQREAILLYVMFNRSHLPHPCDDVASQITRKSHKNIVNKLGMPVSECSMREFH